MKELVEKIDFNRKKSGCWEIKLDISQKKWALGNKTGHSQMRKWTLSSKIRHFNKIVWIDEKYQIFLLIYYNFTFMLLYYKIGSVKVKK